MIESDLQTYINKDLREMGIKYIHFEKGRYHKNKTHRKGIPDILIFPGQGLVYFIELKMPGKHLTVEQAEYYQWCIDHKYKFFVFRTVEDYNLFKEVYLNGIADNIEK